MTILAANSSIAAALTSAAAALFDWKLGAVNGLLALLNVAATVVVVVIFIVILARGVVCSTSYATRV